MLSIRGTNLNFRACSASGKMWTFLHVQSMLSIRGTNFIAHWAYGELISSPRFTGLWDHKVLVSAKKVKKKYHACVPLTDNVYCVGWDHACAKDAEHIYGENSCLGWCSYGLYNLHLHQITGTQLTFFLYRAIEENRALREGNIELKVSSSCPSCSVEM